MFCSIQSICTPQAAILLTCDFQKYVKVAKGQSGIMSLGGNLPESLIQHTMLGSNDGKTNEVEEVAELESEKKAASS